MIPNALVLTGGLLHTSDAKTAHGLIRESNRFNIVGFVDSASAGKDAGEVLDGRNRNLPIFASVNEALDTKPEYCVVGVATTGGIFPDSMLADVKIAIKNGLSIVNGLHDYLNDRPEMLELAKQYNVELIDIRRPKNRKDLHFWTGAIKKLEIPVIAMLGTDCSLGKRTTTRFILKACSENNIHAEMIYTGQTGWLQGGKYGFVFDSTLNDFVGGEMEHAILSCAKEANPDVILIEGQAALRNPSGPCGSEMLISGNAKYVVLVHAPKRKYYEHEPSWGAIPDLESEIELIRLYGSKVIAIALNTEDCSREEALDFKNKFHGRYNLPVMLPLEEGCDDLIPLIKELL
ncbi:DUF1611 domain-containing protein [Daejeonella lutea]|uniref:Uncharacterized conserved protein, NAD-dependent epimerase/dehydratase family n=1 Tax=Daejeonella lutea TaxID=572036 RepID=A0A1T5F7Y5_9SPHI|nr:DUF1611 domain-containing protein [Daejeonella lutea]SKB92286.1 Uncharacterized conserved protein, NAD-dependent epimerase/dehydratase family [Daejeonella lutea]